jgi:hypothetical protein
LSSSSSSSSPSSSRQSEPKPEAAAPELVMEQQQEHEPEAAPEPQLDEQEPQHKAIIEAASSFEGCVATATATATASSFAVGVRPVSAVIKAHVHGADSPLDILARSWTLSCIDSGVTTLQHVWTRSAGLLAFEGKGALNTIHTLVWLCMVIFAVFVLVVVRVPVCVGRSCWLGGLVE